ncbi:MAG: hypothetical protein M0019_03560 [Actinomycetota bacterium]|nr:hypothetical protein [Actinomycetota bacterium]
MKSRSLRIHAIAITMSSALLTGVNFAIATQPAGAITTTSVVGGSLVVGDANDGSLNIYSSIPSGTGSVAPTGQLTSIKAANTYATIPGKIIQGPNGNIWELDLVSGNIYEFTPEQFYLNENPSATISSKSVSVSTTSNVQSTFSPSGLAFDKFGNLWVSTQDGIVSEYSAAQLTQLPPATSAALTPNQLLDFPGYKISGITFHQLNSTGNAPFANYMFLTVYGSAQKSTIPSAIFGIDISQLTGAAVTIESNFKPNISISGNNSELLDPTSPIFDASGNLWVSKTGSTIQSDNTITEFTPSQLSNANTAATTPNLDPKPEITIAYFTSNGLDSIDGGDGITFDQLGNLYVSNVYSTPNANYGSVVEFSQSQLYSSPAGTTITPLPFDHYANKVIGQPFSITYLNIFGRGVLALGDTGSTISPKNTIFGANTLLLNIPLAQNVYHLQPYAMALDPEGNLWVADYATNNIDEYTRFDIANNAPPSVTLSPTKVTYNGGTYSSLDGPIGLAFDSNGNLWVSNNNSSNIVEFSKSEITTDASPTPVATFSNEPTQPNTPNSNSILYTPENNAIESLNGTSYLWVENGNIAQSTPSPSVVAFTMSSLTGTTGLQQIPAPAIQIEGHQTDLNSPYGLTFDSNGNLWISNFNGQNISEWTKSQLISDLNNSPSVQSPYLNITSGNANGNGIDNPGQIAFDAGGNLFVSNSLGPNGNQSGTISEFTQSQIAGLSGNVQLSPSSINSGATSQLNDPQGLAFLPGIPVPTAPTTTTPTPTTPTSPTQTSPTSPSTLPSRKGYWLVGADGGVFAYGDAQFFGSAANISLNKPIVGVGE